MINFKIVYFLLDTWRKDIEPIDIEDAINKDASGKLRVVSISKVYFPFRLVLFPFLVFFWQNLIKICVRIQECFNCIFGTMN